MLTLNDIYTSSGTNTLYGCWTSDVTKFDASSFYNWEEDNLPLLDLHERTHLLWEKLGHPTSSLTGFAFVVSADAGAQTCNSNIFTSLSSCLEKLPEVINYPILIEVASFGQLGELKISNKRFGPRGSIEIINRNFAAMEGSTSSLIVNGHLPYAGNADGLASSVIFCPTSGALAATHTSYSSIPSIIHGLVYSKCVSIDSYVFSSVGLTVPPDDRLYNNLTVFTRLGSPTFENKLTAALAVDNGVSAWSNQASGILSFQPYELGTIAATIDEVDVYDASTINDISEAQLLPDVPLSNDVLGYATTYAYGNRLSKILIENCNGPIFIRGLTVDGGSYSGIQNGIEIVNSNNIYVERCSASRCTKAGLLAVNSNVTLLRGFVGYRNYNFKSNSTRAQVPYLQKIRNVKFDASAVLEDGAGIRLINSNLQLSSTLDRDELYSISTWNNWSATELAVATVIKPLVPATGWMFCLTRNSIGIDAINSKISGGQKERLSTTQSAAEYYNATNLIAEYNTEAGIRLIGSDFDYDGRTIVQGNFMGLDALDSSVNYDILLCRRNQKEGFNLRNSVAKYNKNLLLPNGNTPAAATNQYKIHHNSFVLNGVHIRMSNSEYAPTECSGIPAIYERFLCTSGFGIYLGKKLPSIIVDNNSTMKLIHPGIENVSSLVYQAEPSFGEAISVRDGSNLSLHGSKSYTTKIIGPDGVLNQQKKAGLYATNNSTIKISGPTVIAKYAIDVLGDNNSNIIFEPHITHTGLIDVQGMDMYDPANHTTVELHSTRACIVVDNGSTLVMKDLGDYRGRWAAGTYGANILTSSVDYNTEVGSLATELLTYGGSMQFYPNANDTALYPPGIANPTISLYSTSSMTSSIHVSGYQYGFSTGQYVGDSANNFQFSGITTGGVCVRATNNSLVDVINVHFPCGWWNPSSVIYDISGVDSGGPLCSRTFIWNIADNSLLNARYISVSGHHPADVGYHGPSGDWGVSSAPSTTPDTSSLSVLDYYGISTRHRFGKSTQQNLGPFRLYFSYAPEANWLTTSSNGGQGYIPQVFAQGYHFSAATVCPSSVSSLYTSLWKANGTGIVTSGFYYANEIVNSPTTVKAVLDDSAANTFANAKHCSVGKSNLPKVVSILHPVTQIYGGDSADASAKSYGKGFKSSNSFDLERDN